MMPRLFTKDPLATLDYGIDWAEWLDDDTISESDWEAEDGITIAESPAPSKTDTTTTVWLSGGTLGDTYEITNHIVTAAGREDDRTFKVTVTEK